MDIKTVLLTGILLLCIGSINASATSVEPLSDFNPIVDVKDSMIPGSEYFASFEFTANYDTVVVINFTVEHPEINSDEWCTTIIFNETSFSDETAPGVFSTGEVEIDKGYHLIEVYYKSHIAVLPDVYNLTLHILSEDVVIESSRRSGGGFRGSLPMPTPNATATAEPSDDRIPNVTATSAPVIFTVGGQEPPEPRSNLYLIGLIFLVVIILLMVRKWIIKRFY